MNIGIKNYIKYYIGCEAMLEDRIKVKICGIKDNKPILRNLDIAGGFFFTEAILHEMHFIKPILRKLESMTEEEIKELFRLRPWAQPDTVSRTSFDHGMIQIEGTKDGEYFSDWFDIRTLYPTQFHYLLSRGFDLFNLIENGLAIDKSTLENSSK